ncbi:hypothetical protein GCM10018966_077560 [Streptomyces yanii]
MLALPAPASAATVTIASLQGNKRISPYNGQQVTVSGVVTAIRSTGSSRGYWIQDSVGDGNPATSEAVFAYTGSSTPSTKVGNMVTVRGNVSEYYPGGSSADGQSITELTQPQIQSTASTGNPLPAPWCSTPHRSPPPTPPAATSGTGLTDLPATLPAGERYTYVYQGNSQVLDHILTSPSLSSYDYDIDHINAEFADKASDHDPQVVRLIP